MNRIVFAFGLIACSLSLGCQSNRDAGERPVAGESPLFEVRVDDAGSVRFELPAPDEDGVLGEYLFVTSLGRGLGANDVGLDRGQLGPTRVVRFRLLGERVLLEAENLRYRATDAPAAEALATRQSFATSVLWAGPLEKRGRDSVVFDATSLVVRDAHGAARTMRSTEQGDFSLDLDRSGVDPELCLAFPDNVELGAFLTFGSDEPGSEVRATSPDPHSVTLEQRQSFLRLPDDEYRVREWDPRSGSFAVSYMQTTADIEAPNMRRLANRHRLQKKNSRGEVVEPIVYYVDRGAPEPIRSALLDGARWWAEAFEAAGFVDAYRVEILPEHIHPLDIRYNVIQWVHRSTRGWSYGGSLEDPRTGEIVTGRVTLGSLRVRQDRLLFEGLLGASESGTGSERDPVELALARIRQLAAHEVGHTLGLAHNFAASTNDRASVMDYPAPWIRVGEGGELETTNAYAVGIGAWDVLAIRWLYTEFEPGVNEAVALHAIVSERVGRGLRYFSDADARPAGAANPAASLWDNGEDPVDELGNVLAVRRAAIAKFGVQNLAGGRPAAELEEVFTPLYFSHRYQLEAAAKVIGGVEWRHRMNGESAAPVEPIPGDRQRLALSAVLETVSTEVLDVPESVLEVLAPRPPGVGRHRELPASDTLPVFDALGVAEVASRMTFDMLFQPQRCARLVDQARRDSSAPSLEFLLQSAILRTFPPSLPTDARAAAIVQGVQRSAIASLIRLGFSPGTSARVRAVVEAELTSLLTRLKMSTNEHDLFVARRIERAFSGDADLSPIETHEAPPGSPIGCGYDG